MGALIFSVGLVSAAEGIDKDEVRQLLGEVYMIQKDYPASIEKYREVLKRDPSNTKARTELADILSWQRNYDEAILEYKKVLEIRPDDFEVKKKLAAVFTWKKDYPSAQALYQELIAQNSARITEKVSLAELLVRLGKPEEAKRLLEEVLKKDPGDLEAKVALADVYAGQEDLGKALALYREVLDTKYDRKTKAKMGDVLSWRRQYSEALRIYDELLDEKEEKEVRLQKARILGWARQYSRATKEYQRILSEGPDEGVDREMRAKHFYWNNRVQHAIAAYKELIAKEPENVEAMFDLSQIYSYQSMWKEAIGQYEGILSVAANHFRARAGLEKSELFSKHPSFTSGYEFFKAHSGSRDVDIRKNVVNALLDIPLNEQTFLGVGYKFVRRAFRDFHDLTENHARFSLSYENNPRWAAGAFFNLVTYNRSVAPVYEFGGQFAFRTFDLGQMTLSAEQQRLENNSEVIRRRYFQDDFKVRQDLDLTKRWKAGADYSFSYFSNHNHKNEVGADTLYYLTLEPKAFFIKYRYAFRDFKRRDSFYYAPHDYSLHTISVRWKHYLNKKEIYFGADDIYYEVGYDFSMDSTGIISHQIMGGIGWDITKRFQIKGEGQYTHSTTKIYEDAGAKASMRYFF